MGCEWQFLYTVLYSEIHETKLKCLFSKCHFTFEWHWSWWVQCIGQSWCESCERALTVHWPLRCLDISYRIILNKLVNILNIYWTSKLNVLLVYPACRKWKYHASEDADCRESARSLFPSVHTALSLSASVLFCERLKGAVLSFSVKSCCFSNFTCKYSRNHSTAIVFILCVAYLILSDDGSIINKDYWAD